MFSGHEERPDGLGSPAALLVGSRLLTYEVEYDAELQVFLNVACGVHAVQLRL